jgi:hypothetical protein
MRPYIVRHLLGTGAAAVVVVAFSGGWPVYESVAQVDEGTNHDVLRVEQCIEASASVGRPADTLIEEEIIEEDLLRSKVTNSMCEDMLKGIPDGTPVPKLVATQRYMQEIKLIEKAMGEAVGKTAGGAAAKEFDRYFVTDGSFVSTRTVAAATQIAAAAQYFDGKGPGASSPSPGAGGEGDGSEVTLRTTQAGAAASVGEDDDASIAERLREKEAAAMKEGASAPEAAAGARCGVEVDVLDDEVEKIEGMYEVKPLMPEEMRHGETEQAGLLVSPITKQKFQEVREEYGVIAEASESNTGCVVLADRMKAKLVPFEGLVIDRHQPDDVRELSPNLDTRWGWDITASQTGEQDLYLDLRYAISREGSEFRPLEEPVYEGAIKVSPLQSDSTQNATEQEAEEQPWWRRIFGGILERIFGVIGP